ncbi:MAG: amino acid permease C-terminal domain-containing protein, partial [Aquimonas sp.]
NRPRAYKVPMAWLICPLAIFGCLFLFLNLSGHTELLFLGWTALGLVVYFLYGYRKSQLARTA